MVVAVVVGAVDEDSGAGKGFGGRRGNFVVSGVRSKNFRASAEG